MSQQPRGKKPLTRTTTRTLPALLSGAPLPISTSSDSLERSEGVDADDTKGRVVKGDTGKARGSSAMFTKHVLKSSIAMLSRWRCDRYIQGRSNKSKQRNDLQQGSYQSKVLYAVRYLTYRIVSDR